MEFTIKQIRSFVKDAREEPSTGNSWLDTRYEEVSQLIGHTNPYYIAFFIIAEELQPEFVVELGSWRAYAAAHFAEGAEGCRVVTIDIHKDNQDDKQKAIEVCGQWPNLDYINKWTWDAVPDVEAYDLPIDILFIDAWHEYEYAMKEWELFEPLLADNALVICDDIMDAEGATKDMIRFWKEISKGRQAFLDESLHDGVPMGFMQYVRK